MKIQIRESALAARVCRPPPTGICLSNKRLSTGNWDNSCEWKLNDSFRRRKSELVNPRDTRLLSFAVANTGWKIVSRESRSAVADDGNASRPGWTPTFLAANFTPSLRIYIYVWDSGSFAFSNVRMMASGIVAWTMKIRFVLIQNYQWQFREQIRGVKFQNFSSKMMEKEKKKLQV